jgi:hypothetical protein
MKKTLFFLVICLFTANFIFAQNTSTMIQTGDNNTSDILQEGNNLSNQKVIGDDNKTFIRQWGNTNSTFSLTIGDGNNVKIWQNGNNNKSGTNTLLGLGLLQLGNLNTFDIDQTGERNVSNATQIGNENYIRTYQSDFNKSLVVQGGNLNSTSIQQHEDYNDSKIAQTGNSNVSDVLQESDYNKSNLIQLLNSNFARIEQKTGNMNEVNLTQSDESEAYILQDGAENVVMGIGADIIATSLDGSYLELNQTGNGNVLHLRQTASSSKVNQDGLTNTAVIIQN